MNQPPFNSAKEIKALLADGAGVQLSLSALLEQKGFVRKSWQHSRRAQQIASLGHIEWIMAREIARCSKGIREVLMLPEQTAFSSYEHFTEYVHPEDRLVG